MTNMKLIEFQLMDMYHNSDTGRRDLQLGEILETRLYVVANEYKYNFVINL